uniref:CCHC-type domain-containing protein n=1 Tax=Ditylenchus dipsaci TaxID=166011 RepID=A0A915D6I6_9BILA
MLPLSLMSQQASQVSLITSYFPVLKHNNASRKSLITDYFPVLRSNADSIPSLMLETSSLSSVHSSYEASCDPSIENARHARVLKELSEASSYIFDYPEDKSLSYEDFPEIIIPDNKSLSGEYFPGYSDLQVSSISNASVDVVRMVSSAASSRALSAAPVNVGIACSVPESVPDSIKSLSTLSHDTAGRTASTDGQCYSALLTVAPWSPDLQNPVYMKPSSVLLQPPVKPDEVSSLIEREQFQVPASVSSLFERDIFQVPASASKLIERKEIQVPAAVSSLIEREKFQGPVSVSGSKSGDISLNPALLVSVNPVLSNPVSGIASNPVLLVASVASNPVISSSVDDTPVSSIVPEEEIPVDARPQSHRVMTYPVGVVYQLRQNLLRETQLKLDATQILLREIQTKSDLREEETQSRLTATQSKVASLVEEEQLTQSKLDSLQTQIRLQNDILESFDEQRVELKEFVEAQTYKTQVLVDSAKSVCFARSDLVLEHNQQIMALKLKVAEMSKPRIKPLRPRCSSTPEIVATMMDPVKVRIQNAVGLETTPVEKTNRGYVMHVNPVEANPVVDVARVMNTQNSVLNDNPARLQPSQQIIAKSVPVADVTQKYVTPAVLPQPRSPDSRYSSRDNSPPRYHSDNFHEKRVTFQEEEPSREDTQNRRWDENPEPYAPVQQPIYVLPPELGYNNYEPRFSSRKDYGPRYSRSVSPSGRYRNPDRNIQCYNCNGFGHKANQCSSRNYPEQRYRYRQPERPRSNYYKPRYNQDFRIPLGHGANDQVSQLAHQNTIPVFSPVDVKNIDWAPAKDDVCDPEIIRTSVRNPVVVQCGTAPDVVKDPDTGQNQTSPVTLHDPEKVHRINPEQIHVSSSHDPDQVLRRRIHELEEALGFHTCHAQKVDSPDWNETPDCNIPVTDPVLRVPGKIVLENPVENPALISHKKSHPENPVRRSVLCGDAYKLNDFSPDFDITIRDSYEYSNPDKPSHIITQKSTDISSNSLLPRIDKNNLMTSCSSETKDPEKPRRRYHRYRKTPVKQDVENPDPVMKEFCLFAHGTPTQFQSVPGRLSWDAKGVG